MFPAALMQEGEKADQDDVKHEQFPGMPWGMAATTPQPTPWWFGGSQTTPPPKPWMLR